MVLLTTQLVCTLGLLAIGVLALALEGTRGRLVAYGGSLALCFVNLVCALTFLGTRHGVETLTLPLGLPSIGANFRLDALSAFFLVIVNLGAASASLYGIGYGAHEHEPRRVQPFFAVFLAAMNLVPLADDAFVFLVAWEFMSLASWALVMAHPRDPENAHAGLVYLVMASFGTLALLLAFGVMAGAQGSFSFAAIRAGHATTGEAAIILLFVLLGAGSKAGIVPLHAWLPLAHPAAPSHVSALMSGVMTKVAIYGFIRIVLDLVGAPPWWWGAVVLALGGATAFLGILYALMQQDLKRLLAYSTVENVGIVFIGIGLALAFAANGMHAGAALALTAALFHAFNHALFKSLLFFGAGAVLTATGERDMEKLGGLIHGMPVTAFTFLAGAVAISALPPFNGFVSELLTFQAILVSPDLPQWGLKFLVPAAGATLALSAALAATCFVRAFGITFLGRPRTPQATLAREVDRWSLATMVLLAGLCLITGILPGFVIDGLAPVVAGLVGARLPAESATLFLSVVPISGERSSYNGLVVLVFMLSAGMLTAFTVHRVGTNRLRRAPPWDCGTPDPRPVTQYTASSFAQPIRRVFGAIIFGARETVDMPRPGDARPARFTLLLTDPIWTIFYAPVAAITLYGATRLNAFQFLTIRRYLTLVFGALILLLSGLAIWH